MHRTQFCHFIAGRATYRHDNGEVIEVRPPSGGDAATARQVAVASGVAWRPWTGVLPRAELWIDAVFGTGLSRAIDGEPAAALRAPGPA